MTSPMNAPVVIDRFITNIAAADVHASAEFYKALFQFNIAFESDWFIQLTTDNKDFELGIIQADHELLPAAFRGKPLGIYLTFVVADLAPVIAQAKAHGYEVVQAPELTFYGQLRALIKDPGGVLVDISAVDANAAP
ncbi:MAG: VOC family protein [Deinococcota bacterium]